MPKWSFIVTTLAVLSPQLPEPKLERNDDK